MSNPPRVLVADDEKASLKLMRRIMEREGFQVKEVTNGSAALDVATQETFDLILMDINMPGMDGFEVVKRLRADHAARVPVIFITARHTEPDDVERGLGLGADDYMRKPFEPRELVARARHKIQAYKLEESLKKRTQELEALVRIGGELNEELDSDALIDNILHTAAQEIPSDNGILFLYHDDMSVKSWHILHMLEDRTTLVHFLNKLSGRLARLPQEGWQGTYPPENELVQAYGYRSAAWVNLYHHGEKIGTLGVGSLKEDNYTEDDLRFLRSIAKQAALAIRNAEMHTQLREHASGLEELVRIGEELNEKLDLDALVEHILRAAVREIPADHGVLFLYGDVKLDEPPIKRWAALGTLPPNLDQGTFSEYAAEFRAISSDGLVSGAQEGSEFFRPYGYQSAVWAALHHHGEVMGSLNLVHKAPDAYTGDHLRLLQSIARQAALAVRNAELYEELRGYVENLEEMVAERQAELEAAQESLIRSEKLASLGRLSASIAHEINNPLHSLLNCLNMAVEDVSANTLPDVELLQVAEQSVLRIQNITQELLSFAREGRDEYAAVDLNKLIQENFILTQKQIQHANVDLVATLDPLLPVQAVADRLRQVFVNLTLNALEAMPGGGTLHVRSLPIGDSLVMVSFEDTGIGIPPEHIKNLFEPFFSTKGENGTGLGLWVSYTIVEGHGGSIEVESEPGKGTTFYIWLPVIQGELMPPQRAK